ncbi:MAG: RDD family protein [Segniliparus sp.]|uniref:RDD family protein n=1 Tax=Segniliparus sp. TaxID=2804064 RepID=UPI003F2D9969
MYSTQRPRLRTGEAASQGTQRKDRAPRASRVLAALVDALVVLPFGVLLGVVQAHKESSGLYSGTSVGAAVASVLLSASALAVFVWNVVVKQGRTGQTIGKEVLKIKLVQEGTGLPVGNGRVLLRHVAHIDAGKRSRAVVVRA